jgi:hypothetical protein
MLWLRRWNFIERARLERELWDAFERGEDLEALLNACRDRAAAGAAQAALEAFRLEVWQQTLQRIRRIEALMAGQRPPSSSDAEAERQGQP